MNNKQQWLRQRAFWLSNRYYCATSFVHVKDENSRELDEIEPLLHDLSHVVSLNIVKMLNKNEKDIESFVGKIIDALDPRKADFNELDTIATEIQVIKKLGFHINRRNFFFDLGAPWQTFSSQTKAWEKFKLIENKDSINNWSSKVINLIETLSPAWRPIHFIP